MKTLREKSACVLPLIAALGLTACGGGVDTASSAVGGNASGASSPAASSSPTTTTSTGPATPTKPVVNQFDTTATPYQPKQSLTTYQAAPSGFTPVYTEAVVRHGSRGLSSFDASAYNMWLQASKDGALTPLGAKLGPDLMTIIKANALLGAGVSGIAVPGFGNLSATGANEETQIAARMVQRLPTYFAQLPTGGSGATPRQIIVSTSGVQRAVDSSGFFTRSLVNSVPALAPLVTLSAPLVAYPASKPVAQAAGINRFLLYFHKLAAKTDQVTNSADPYFVTYNDSLTYQAYLTNANQLAKVNSILQSATATANANTVLLALFTPAFVAKIANGTYTFSNTGSYTFTNASGSFTATVTGDNSVGIASVTDAASELYAFYQIAPGMTTELNNLDFTQYIPDAQASVLAYFDDATTFYQKGPGITEDNPITYKMGQVLLNDMFNEVDAVVAGNLTHGAKLRFTHAEDVIPLESLLNLKNVFVPVPNASTYTYANNPWRGSTDSPLAANLQWDVYSNGQGTYLVKMLFNEQETDFQAACDGARYAAGSEFYDYTKLKACYNHVAAAAA